MKKITGITIGAALIACGIIYILGVLGFADVNFSLSGWWAFFIIIPGLNGIVYGKDKFGSALCFLVGVMLLLAAQGVFDYETGWKIIIPLIFVMLGIKMIAKSLRPQSETVSGTEKEPKKYMEILL